MAISTLELAQTRELVASILSELQFDAYLFEVEPGEGKWELKIECAVEEGWVRVILTASKELLLQAVDDSSVRQSLMDDWHKTLSACLIEAKTSAT